MLEDKPVSGGTLADVIRNLVVERHSYDIDGRPTVGRYEDPLLVRLFEVHHQPRYDIFQVKKAT